MAQELQEIQVACFRLGEELFAVDIMRIKEILKPLKLARIPRSPSFVEGVVNLRGAIVPVIDLRRRFELPPRSDENPGKLLTVVIAKQVVGLMVDDVTEVATIPVHDIKPPPEVVRGLDSAYLVGVCVLEGEMVMLLNLDRILSRAESSVIAGLGRQAHTSGRD